MLQQIWNSDKPYIIAEVSQNHDGSLGQAHAFIDAVKSTGADAIKFQTHIAEEESTPYEPFRVMFSYEDRTRYDYWQRMEFTEEQWVGLYEHATSVGLDFLSSPFSLKALEMLDRIGVPAWKFGAGEVFNSALVDAAIRTGKPLLLSTGLSTYSDIDAQVRRIEAGGNQYLLFQCVTAYPSTAEMIDIGLIGKLSERYGCRVGISDHSSTIYPSLAAVTLGAAAVEVHITMSPYMFGPDVKASVNIEQLKQIVEGSRFIAAMRKSSVDMGCLSTEKAKLREMFSKGLFAAIDLKAGTLLRKEMLAAKKPNIGVDSNQMDQLIGKKLVRDIEKNEPIMPGDVE